MHLVGPSTYAPHASQWYGGTHCAVSSGTVLEVIIENCELVLYRVHHHRGGLRSRADGCLRVALLEASMSDRWGYVRSWQTVRLSRRPWQELLVRGSTARVGIVYELVLHVAQLTKPSRPSSDPERSGVRNRVHATRTDTAVDSRISADFGSIFWSRCLNSGENV